jgi:hypothetical protein
VSVVTVTVPVAGTLAAGNIVQRSERLSRREERTAAKEVADRAEAATQTEAHARAVADVMTTGLAWRRALSQAEVARRDQGQRGVGSRMQVNVEELTNVQAAFGTAVFTALASTPGEMDDALNMLENAYETGIDVMREVAEDSAAVWAQSTEHLSSLVARGMTALQSATRSAAPATETPHHALDEGRE